MLCPLSVVVVVLSLLTALGPPAAAQPSVTMLSCVIGAGGNGRLGLEVGFRNDSPDALKSTVWRAHLSDNAWFDFGDSVSVEPHATSTHVLYQRRLLISKAYYRDDVRICSLVRAQYADGSEWQSSDFGEHFQRSTPRPDDAAPIPATIDNPAHDPVGVVACLYDIETHKLLGSPAGGGVGLLAVRFRNLSTRTIDQVVFRVPYLSGGFDFIDGGSFAPGVLISSDQYFEGAHIVGRKLMRDLPANLPGAYQTLNYNPENCITVSAHFSDGSSWQNPNVGPTEPPAPTAPPTLPPT